MNDYTLYLVKRAYYKKQLIKRAAGMGMANMLPKMPGAAQSINSPYGMTNAAPKMPGAVQGIYNMFRH